MTRLPTRLPGFGDVLGLLQTQAEALLALPSLISQLSRTVGQLTETVQATRDSVATMQRLARRADRLMDELEEPMLALKPGLTRLAAVLDNPAIDRLPATIEQVSEGVMPILKTLNDTQGRIAYIAGQTERLTTAVESTSSKLMNLPGTVLFGRRPRPADEDLEPPPGQTP